LHLQVTYIIQLCPPSSVFLPRLIPASAMLFPEFNLELPHSFVRDLSFLVSIQLVSLYHLKYTCVILTKKRRCVRIFLSYPSFLLLNSSNKSCSSVTISHLHLTPPPPQHTHTETLTACNKVTSCHGELMLAWAQKEGEVCIALNQLTTEAGDLRGTVADHAVNSKRGFSVLKRRRDETRKGG
jgi:hypothetical protein